MSQRSLSAILILGLIAALFLSCASRQSSEHDAKIIRAIFNYGSAKMRKALEAHTPTTAITVLSDQQYRAGDPDARLDVYYRQTMAAGSRRPLIIWTHGGGWLSGDKTNAAPYFKLLAAEGYVVISPNYSLAPEKKYPAPIFQMNDAYAFIQLNAAHFYIDTNQIFLAGDSAGAQISAQMAALITNPNYAESVGIQPSLTPQQLRGVILNCGIYKMAALTTSVSGMSPLSAKILDWGNNVTLQAYSGTRDVSDPIIRQMSPYYYVTPAFPPAYISGGNGDLLTATQSKPLADQLRSLGVEVTTLFYPDDHTPVLNHEYQFDLDNEEGQHALAATLQFLRDHIDPME